LCDFSGNAAAENLLRSGECEKDAAKVYEQEHPIERQMGKVHNACKDRSEEREAQVLGDEGRVVGEERGVERVLYAGDVEAAILGEGMVAVDEQREERKRCEDREPSSPPPGRGLLERICGVWDEAWTHRCLGVTMRLTIQGVGEEESEVG
jgi:hypothetical protein